MMRCLGGQLCDFHWQRFCEAEKHRWKKAWGNSLVRRAIADGIQRDVR